MSGWSSLAEDWQALGADAMLTKRTPIPELLAAVDRRKHHLPGQSGHPPEYNAAGAGCRLVATAGVRSMR